MYRMFTSKEGLEIIDKEFDKLFENHIKIMENEITNLPPEMEVESKSLKEHVFEALGHASVCWNPAPAGQFDSREATKAGETLMRHINTDVPHACGIVFKALREDPDYYRAWKDNIAMAYMDECTKPGKGGQDMSVQAIANRAAENFLNLLIKPIDNE
jgi:hypothetical protein